MTSMLSSETSNSLNKHFHERLSFAVVTEGTGRFNFKDRSIQVGKGAIIKIIPGQTHTSGTALNNKPLKYLVFHISIDELKQVLLKEDINISDTFGFKQEVTYNRPFFWKFLKTYQSLSSKSELIEKESLISELLTDLIINFTDSNSRLPREELKPKYLRSLVDFIHEHYKNEISLVELSSISKKSPSQIIRAFKKELGITPNSYILNVRLNEVKNQIQEGKSITQTALEMGFSDQSHMHRFFVRNNYFTPFAFANAISR